MNLLVRCYSRYRPITLSKLNEFGRYHRLAPTQLLWQPPTYLSKLKEILPKIKSPPPWAYDTSFVPPTFTDPKPLSEDEQKRIRDAGKLCKQALLMASECVQVGITSDQVDEKVFDFITRHGGYPSCLGYRGFPKSMCISINNVLAHGIPDSRPFKPTDLVTLDIALSYEGIHADCATTIALPDVDTLGRDFRDHVSQAYQSTMDHILSTDHGAFLSLTTLPTVFHSSLHRSPPSPVTVLPYLCGHGIGEYFHMAPVVSPVLPSSSVSPITLGPGSAFTFEPVVVQGSCTEPAQWLDGWTLVSKSGARSVQFEDTYLVTQHGMEVVTVP